MIVLQICIHGSAILKSAGYRPRNRIRRKDKWMTKGIYNVYMLPRVFVAVLVCGYVPSLLGSPGAALRCIIFLTHAPA